MAHIDDALEHVGYEWWMFRELFALLDSVDDSPDPLRNALLESLAVHGRNLGHFFFAFDGRRAAEFNADDLGITLGLLAEPLEMRTWRQQTNQRMAHLLKGRVQPKTNWQGANVRALLAERIDALKKHVGPSIPVAWIGDIASGSKWLMPGPVGRGGNFTPTMPAQPPATPSPAAPGVPDGKGP